MSVTGESAGAMTGGLLHDASANGSESAAAPPHLVELAGGWHLWRTVCLRGTGFPVSMLEPFGAPQAAAAVDALMAAEAAQAEARSAALEVCVTGRRAVAPSARTIWNRAFRQIYKGQVSPDAEQIPALAPLVGSLARAGAEIVAASQAVEREIDAARERNLRALREVAADPRFRQALMWQNRAVLHGAVDKLQDGGRTARTNRQRARERIALIYLQRYASRNESIGFFGPIGWGNFAESGRAMALRPGPGLVTERLVEFEPWATRVIGAVFSREPGLRPWLAPRRNPVIRIDDTGYYDSEGRHRELPPPAARLLRRCDGIATAREIAASLAAESGAGFKGEPDVLRTLVQLAQNRFVIWHLEVPLGPYPERLIAEKLAGVGDGALRKNLLARLDELVAARDRVKDAFGDPSALDTALGDLELRFEKFAGKTAAQLKGTRKVGRSIAYEDCRRDAELTIGPEALARLGPPLALVLAGARWLTDMGTNRAIAEIAAQFADLRAKSAGPAVEFAELWNRLFAKKAFSDEFFAPVVAEFQAKWMKILPVDSGRHRIDLSVAALAPQVAAAFAVAQAPSSRMLHHSPDIMIAAESVDAICRGDYQFVLGEVHPGFNSQLQSVFLRTHPDPGAQVAAWERDVSRQPHFLPTWPWVERRSPYSVSPLGYEIACNEAPPRQPHERVFALADLVAEETPGGIVVRTRDGTRAFHVLDVFGYFLRAWGSRSFQMFPPAEHCPRITIDDFVVRRESWRFPCGEASFVGDKGETARFIAMRRWARAHELPRRIFVRFPQEQKPVYIDLESPAFVELAIYLWRAALAGHKDGSVTVTEMLPSPEQTWLVDAGGNRYTSELRIVAVDPAVRP